MTSRPKSNEPRINRRIRVREVRVIGPEGDQLGIMPTELAFQRAQDLGLDLVEVSPTARPPVCKIMDYGRYKYTTKKKAVEQRRNQRTIDVKEVKFRPKTDVHDFEVKERRAQRFLEEGNKVKVTIMFRGREITHPEIGRSILEKVSQDLQEIASVEFMPRMEGRTMFMVLAPQKAGKSRAQKAKEKAQEKAAQEAASKKAAAAKAADPPASGGGGGASASDPA